MENKHPGWTLKELSELLGGRLDGPPGARIERPVPSDSSDPGGITFAENAEHLALAERSGVGAIIVGKDCGTCTKPTIVVDDPRQAFALLLVLVDRPAPIYPGVHHTAVIGFGAKIAGSARIGPYVVVEATATVGPGARVFPFCYVGENCSVGEKATLYPHVVLYRNVEIGKRCIVHAGCVLGADGFGYSWSGEERVKVPQVGSVSLADGVEIGANSAVDRATAGETTIGEGTKIDNLVQIGHNVKIGEHTVIAGLSGLSGSSELGSRVTMGGQAALSHHVKVADDVVLGGRTGVTQDITEPGEYFGLPARPINEAIRSMSLVTKLPALVKQIRKLEKRIEDLEAEKP